MDKVNVLQATLRTLTSILVAAVFLLLLVVASAQHQATVSLQDAKADVSYSVARQVIGEADGYRVELRDAQKILKSVNDEARVLQSEMEETKRRYYKEMVLVREVAVSISRSGRCDRFPTASAPTEDDMSLWRGVNSCFSENVVPAQVVADLKQLQAPDRNPSELRDRVERLTSQLSSNSQQIDSTKKSVQDLNDRIDKAKAAVNAMEDIRVLDSSWIVRLLGLTSIPPSLMQIFLSFAGGLFGALLLTLILAVYPNNNLNFTAGEGYWNRILLGGLISVSVFVVLGGGVAVLGSKDALSTGGSNFLAFCAIGILSGMFSDRVAKWLSDRAQIFVNDEGVRPNNGRPKEPTV